MKEVFHKIIYKNNHISVWRINSPLEKLIKDPLINKEEIMIANEIKVE